jgi:hypothetical protein
VSVSVSQQKQQLRTVARDQRRHLAAEKKRQAARQRAEQQEARDEQVAPRVQRLPVLGRDGEVLRGARLERDGVSFRRSNPIRNIVARGRNKENPLLSKRHSDAADRLLAAWEMAGGGITFGVASYGVKLSSMPTTGTLSDAVLRGVNAQIDARRELEGVKTVLGARWGALFSIVIAGIDISAWGEAVGMNAHVAAGFLACCLDTLADFYAGPERRGKIRMVEITSPGEREAAD